MTKKKSALNMNAAIVDNIGCSAHGGIIRTEKEGNNGSWKGFVFRASVWSLVWKLREQVFRMRLERALTSCVGMESL